MSLKGTLVRVGAATATMLAIAAVVAALAGRDRPDAQQVAAEALGVPPADVSITLIREKPGGRELDALVEVPGQSGSERVLVGYSVEDGALLRLAWFDRFPDREDEVKISQDQALQRAEELRARFFPEVPVKMELTEAGLDKQVPQYTFGWQGRVAPDALSGDLVLISISAVTGQPTSYLQDVARVRPRVDQLKITRERAIELAEEASKRWWLEESDLAVTVETKSVRLVLSSVQSPHYGPVWMVDQEIHPQETSKAQIMWPLTSQTIDAMSGEVLSVAPH